MLKAKNKANNQKKSLERAVSKTLIMGMIGMLMITGTMLFVLCPYMAIKSIKRDTDSDLIYIMSLMDADYLEDVYKRTKDIYYGMSDAEQADPFSDGFKEHFRQIINETGYKKARNILHKCKDTQGYGEIAFCFYDEENRRMVFVVDGDCDMYYYIPGQWVSEENGNIDTPEIMERIKRSDWYMNAKHAGLYGWSMTDYRDVTDPEGNVIGVAYAEVQISDILTRMGAFTVIYFMLMVLVKTILIALVASFLKNRIVVPIGGLSRTAREYTARDKTKLQGDHKYFGQLQINTGDEIEDLWRSLTDMEDDINDTMTRIREMTSEQERIDAELGVANQIQADMLPGISSPFPDRKEFELYAMMTPAREVGGDFYDFFLTDDDHIALVIADVSDKGIPAALFMMRAKTLIKAQALMKSSPSEILSYANRELCEGNEVALFVTVWIALIELSTGKGVVSNAGHMHPALCRAGESYQLLEYEHSLPLGLVEDTVFEQHDFSLGAGDRLFVYTDGVTEAVDREDRQFGTEGMLKALNDDLSSSPEVSLRHVMDSVKEFAAGVDQADDITMLGFHYLGTEQESR